MEYKTTIGLEIHAELKTKTKMFCDSLNDPNETRPNVNICPVCMGHPGTLPVINKEAVKKVLSVGKSLGGKLATYSQFDRKNYFYPDLPKGYQISQFKYPLVEGGELRGVKITRIHLEEDAGKLIHSKDKSLVDYNRAGLPLMELVTDPVIHSGEVAVAFAKELQLILRYLGASDADMEKGQMRVEANISLAPVVPNGHSIGQEDLSDSEGGLSASEVNAPRGSEKSNSFKTVIEGNSPEAEFIAPSVVQNEAEKFALLGTKVEVKNLNSFRAVERAINYEIKRQADILEEGGKITHETRGWDEVKQQTFSQRKKEESHDYRYFPEPDLPPLDLEKSGLLVDISIPELPEPKRERFKKEYGLKDEQVEMFIRDKKFADYFEETASEYLELEKGNKDARIKLLANYLTSDLQSLMKEKIISFDELRVTPENFAELIVMLSDGDITSRVGKDILKIMIETGGCPSKIVEEKGLKQTNDASELDEVAEKIIKENSQVADDYKNGKEASLQFLIGQGMKATRGSANPEMLKQAFMQKINK